MKIETSNLINRPLDWVVAKIKGIDTRNNACVLYLPFEAETDDFLQFICMADDEAHAKEQCEMANPGCTIDSVEHIKRFSPSTDWAEGGPILEQEGLHVRQSGCQWQCDCWNSAKSNFESSFGPTPLIAIMRGYVTSKLGSSVQVPDDFSII